MRISELKIGRVYLIEMPEAYISDFLVMTKTFDENFVKLYDLTERREKWYPQDELAAAKILGEVVWDEKVLELLKKVRCVGGAEDA